MDATAWIYIVFSAALVGAAAPYGFARTETARRKGVDRLARRIDLAVPTSRIEEERVGMRLAARERYIAIGGGIGLVVAVLATLFLPGFDRNNFSMLGIFLLTLTGIAVGAGISALTTTRELPDDVPRIARLSSPTLRDYVQPLEYGSAIAATVVAVLVTVVALPLGFVFGGLAGSDSVLPIVVTICALLSLMAALLVSRSILGRGQRAGSVLELAWDDAIRATALRDLVSVPLALGFAGSLVPLVTIVSGIRLVQPYTSVDNVLAVCAMIGVGAISLIGVILAIVSLAAKPQRRYRSRLWPEPAGNAQAASADATAVTGTDGRAR
jgi:hypothetical protein